ncbi:hypothetical protein BRARA_K00391 [Brassica rapa]|uniref:Uncharacterized protein n=2 Tax=Brassica campestris TaxID=3711 RepID=A0A397L697_BRACM|nr:hypothetical protein IGI04_013631 [Brassica rapa subsp. trilocularis]RIA05325.1 hypothetical protein BRARA_K00391 [Brassica rapa]
MESSERLVRLGQDPTSEIPFTGNREITKIDDVAIQSTPQDLPLAAAGGLFKIWYHVDYLSSYRLIRTFNQTIESTTTTEQDFFSCFAPQRCSPHFVILPREEEELKEESQRPRPALPKARPRRDPPPRVSRRSSQVSSPIYLRHRFQPRSRNDSSSRRQR